MEKVGVNACYMKTNTLTISLFHSTILSSPKRTSDVDGGVPPSIPLHNLAYKKSVVYEHIIISLIVP